jgi:hypothetical protein
MREKAAGCQHLKFISLCANFACHAAPSKICDIVSVVENKLVEIFKLNGN